MYIDFADLKAKVSIEQAIKLLNLNVKQVAPSQFRAPCPVCRPQDLRALALNTEKKAFFCFGAKTGGDVIGLVAHIKSISAKEAAQFLSPTVPEERVAKEAMRSLQPLQHIQADHPEVLALGISKETAMHFGAGYTGKGLMRGKVAVPIHDKTGTLVVYCGLGDPLHFPSGFNPSDLIFNWHRQQEGEIYIAANPLQVLVAYEQGIENMVAFLTPSITPAQFTQLAEGLDGIGGVAIL